MLLYPHRLARSKSKNSPTATSPSAKAASNLLSMTDLFSYLLPYPAVSLFCDSKLQSLTNLPSKLTVTALLVDSGKSSLVIKQREYQFNPTFSWMSPRPSYGSTATVISTDMGKKKSKFDANTFPLESN